MANSIRSRIELMHNARTPVRDPQPVTIRLGPEHYDPEPARQKIAAAEARRARRNAKRAREAAKVSG